MHFDEMAWTNQILYQWEQHIMLGISDAKYINDNVCTKCKRSKSKNNYTCFCINKLIRNLVEPNLY